MNKQEYEQFQRKVTQTQQKSKRTLLSIDSTLNNVQGTIKKIQENEKNIDQFKQAFGKVMDKLAHSIAGGLGLSSSPFKKEAGKQYPDLPQKLSVEQIIKRMMKHNEILFITGAGVSAPSGIPTFRGTNGLYSKKFEFEGKQYEPQQFITKDFYNKHPQEIWSWVDDIYNLSCKSKPNKIHLLIDEIAAKLVKKGKKVSLVTQNIDNFHLKPEKNEYDVHEVHGNIKFVRCENNHLCLYEKYRERIKASEACKCQQCEKQLRPHVLFFDQSYGPLYGEQIKSKQFPFVFVIGTSLQTNLCIKLVKGANEIVEINPEPAIEIGKVYPFTEQTDVILKNFFDKIK